MAPVLASAIAHIDSLIAALQAGSLQSSTSSTVQATQHKQQQQQQKQAPAAGAAAPRAKPAKAVAAAPPPAVGAAADELFAKTQLAVARVLSAVPHPGSAKLLLCRIAVGGGAERAVVAGLQLHVSAEELTGRLVAVVLNLKPAKLAGELSEAMILAACARLPDGGELVRPVEVPAGAEPGDAIVCEGDQAPAAHPKTLKSGTHRRGAAHSGATSVRPASLVRAPLPPRRQLAQGVRAAHGAGRRCDLCWAPAVHGGERAPRRACRGA